MAGGRPSLSGGAISAIGRSELVCVACSRRGMGARSSCTRLNPDRALDLSSLSNNTPLESSLHPQHEVASLARHTLPAQLQNRAPLQPSLDTPAAEGPRAAPPSARRPLRPRAQATSDLMQHAGRAQPGQVRSMATPPASTAATTHGSEGRHTRAWARGELPKLDCTTSAAPYP